MTSPIHVSLKHTCVKNKLSLAFKKKLKKLDPPAFYTHRPNFKKIEAVCKPYQKYKNIIVIANGGSRTSGLALHRALVAKRNKKHVEFLSTMDPGHIVRLKKQFKPSDTMVLPISKSGTNVDVLDPLTAFWDRYPVLVCTGTKNSVLLEIAKKRGWGILEHPEVGGRYSGRSECAYGLAYLLGLDIRAIDRGAKAAYKEYHYDAAITRNSALQAATACWMLDRKGYTEIFAPVYSVEYAGFLPLMVQLIHESTGKNGKGQTIFGDLAPESQHHTNQRFFGGRKNVLGMFVVNEATMSQAKPQVRIPSDLKDLSLRDGVLGDLNRVPFGKGIQFDFEGVHEEATELGIPHLTISIKDANEHSVGYFLSFLHYFTVYSALLRNQNPFDQPEVEGAKAKSFEKRRKFR